MQWRELKSPEAPTQTDLLTCHRTGREPSWEGSVAFSAALPFPAAIFKSKRENEKFYLHFSIVQ